MQYSHAYRALVSYYDQYIIYTLGEFIAKTSAPFILSVVDALYWLPSSSIKLQKYK